MATELLNGFGKVYLTIDYDAANQWVYNNWIGYQTYTGIISGADACLVPLRENHCAYLLNDNSGLRGPWFDNNLACLRVDGPSLKMWWVTGEVIDDHERPRLAKVASYELDEHGNPPAHERVRERFVRGIRRLYRDKVKDRVRQR